MDNEKNFCFFVISCIKNISVLDVLIYSIKKFTKGEFDIYVSLDGNVESKDEGIHYLSEEEGVPFGKRIYNALSAVPYRNVIVMCDDFIIEEEVDYIELKDIHKQFESNEKLSSVVLTTVSGKHTSKTLPLNNANKKYSERCLFSNYKTTLQCAMWNKAALSNLIYDVQSPWEFELFSNYKTYSSTNGFYALTEGVSPIKYNRGRFMIRGKMILPEKERLEKVLGIKISNENYEVSESYSQVDNLTILDRINRRLHLLQMATRYRIYSCFVKKDLNKIK